MELRELQDKVKQRAADSGDATPGKLLDKVMLSLGHIACKAAYIDRAGVEELGGPKAVAADCAKAIVGLVGFATSLKGDVVVEIEDLLGAAEAARMPAPSTVTAPQVAATSPGGNGADLHKEGAAAGVPPTQGDGKAAEAKSEGKPQEPSSQKEAMYEKSLREAGSKAAADSVYREIVKDRDLDGKTKFRLGQVKKEVEKQLSA